VCGVWALWKRGRYLAATWNRTERRPAGSLLTVPTAILWLALLQCACASGAIVDEYRGMTTLPHTVHLHVLDFFHYSNLLRWKQFSTFIMWSNGAPFVGAKCDQ
jgi:hypothetical protein